MTNVSKPLFAATLRRYHREQYQSTLGVYYSQNNRMHGVWHGRLASELGLVGPVNEIQFDRLSEGQDPFTGAQLIRHRHPAQPEPATWLESDADWKEHLTALFLKADKSTFTDLSAKNQKLKVLPLIERPLPTRAPFTERQQVLIEMHKIAAHVFRENLKGNVGAETRDYLVSRGVSEQLGQEFGLGYARPGTHLVQALQQFGPELMLASGLVGKSAEGRLYDRFRDRLMFPITDENGSIVAFAGRARSDAPKSVPKYLNSPETELYHKRAVLYNLDRAQQYVEKTGRLNIVEGYLDVIAAHAAGVPNTIALSGDVLTMPQAGLIASVASGAVLNLDSDKAGIQATHESAQALLRSGVDVSVLTLPTDKSKTDPAEYVAEYGAKAYRQKISHPDSLLNWLVRDAARAHLSDIPEQAWWADAYAKAAHSVIDSLSSVCSELRPRISADIHKLLGIQPELGSAKIPPMPHRAAYDIVFSAPKSFSTAACVGGDERIFQWHEEACTAAANFMEEKVQMRMGGSKQAPNTGKWIAARFEHDTARPVDGYAAPQIHSHFVVFNMTATDANGQARAIQPRELYAIQTCSTRVYEDVLHTRALEGGYHIVRGANLAPEIAGFPAEYLKAESQRVELIRARQQELGLTGRASSELLSHEGREQKLDLTPDELRASWIAHGQPYGNPAPQIVAEALERARTQEPPFRGSVERAVTYAIERLTERHSVIEEDGFKRQGGILQNALEYGCDGGIDAIRAEIARRTMLTPADIRAGHRLPELIKVWHYRGTAPGQRYTTREMMSLERKVIEYVLNSRTRYEPMNRVASRDEIRERFSGSFAYQQSLHVLWNLIESRDKVQGLEGLAGTGKTHLCQAIAAVVRPQGYEVRGLAPTSGARKELAAVGIEAETLARHNLKQFFFKRHDKPILYLVDESSLVSTRATYRLLQTLGPQDRLIFIGDTRQHQSIEAGRMFAELQQVGMSVQILNKIVRQRENPELLEAIKGLYNSFFTGETKAAIDRLDAMGAIKEYEGRPLRFFAIAKRYLEHPQDTLILSPDNLSRKEINDAVRKLLHESKMLSPKEYTTELLVPRQELFDRDTHLAAHYEVGDRLRVVRGDRALGIRNREHLRVALVDSGANLLTVQYPDGRRLTYNPEQTRVRVTVYRSEYRQFSVGDRVQTTVAWKEKSAPNRQLGTITAIDEFGNAQMRLDRKRGEDVGRLISFNLNSFGHLDHGYTMTSMSSQGTTQRHVLAHIDPSDSRINGMLDKVLGYVMWSRASHDLTIYTSSMKDLAPALSRVDFPPLALSPEQIGEYRNPPDHTLTPMHEEAFVA